MCDICIKEHVQLHNHTDKSNLDGVPPVEKLVEYAKEMGAVAVGVTEHGNTLSMYPFLDACKRIGGINPVIGVEAYMIYGPSYLKKSKSTIFTPDEIVSDPLYEEIYGKLPLNGMKMHNHVLLLALNQKGVENINKIVTFSHRHFYSKPSLTHAFLRDHSDGILASSGCLAAEIPTLLKLGYKDEAEQVLQWYLNIFKDRFFIEFQRHDIPELDDTVNNGLLELVKKYKVPVIATNDIHYLRPEDEEIQRLLLKIATGNRKQKENEIDDSGDAMVFNGSGYHYASPDEMFEKMSVYGEDIAKDMLNNTVAIGKDAKYNPMVGVGFHMPKTHPELTDEQLNEKFRELVYKGAKERYGDPLPQEVIDRIEYELEVIIGKNLVGYFMILIDLIDFARKKGRIWNIRGSGAGCCCLYCLQISHTDPIRHNLLFERFLNPARVNMPDVDIDIPDTFREPLAKYLQQRYGVDKVARIMAYGKIKLKLAIQVSARMYGLNPQDVIALSKAVPNHYSTVEELEEDQNFMHLAMQFKDYKAILDTARKVVNREKTLSMHPAGVLIFDKSLDEYTGLHRLTKVDNSEGDDSGSDDAGGFASLLPAQMDMGAAEMGGFVKFDFLGVRNLTIIEETLRYIKQLTGKEISWYSIPTEYSDAYQVYWKGDNIGIFQVSSDPMRDVFKRLQPTNLDHITAVISLYRPGPMQYIDDYIAMHKGEEEVNYPSKVLEPILKETYGIMVYQEQIIQVLKLAGFSGGDADLIRRAISKKKLKEIVKHKEEFIQGMMQKYQMPAAECEQIWADIEKFAGYGFNKSHASSYAEVSTRTAWLKTHYRLAYLLASLNVEIKHNDKVLTYVGDARKSGIKILPPDVNKSEELFTVEGNNIRYGLAAIKHVATDSLAALVAERKANGNFKSIEDLLNRVNINTSTFAALLLSGALDSIILAGKEGEIVNPRLDGYNQVPKKFQCSIRNLAGFEKKGRKKENDVEVVTDDLAIEGIESEEPAPKKKKAKKEEEPIPVPQNFADWLRGEANVIGGIFVSTHPILLYLKGRKLSQCFNVDKPVIFADALEKMPVNTECYVFGIIEDIYHKLDKNWLWVSVIGFNKPSYRLAAFQNVNKLLPLANVDYLCLFRVSRGNKGFTVSEIRSIGNIYSSTTYI